MKTWDYSWPWWYFVTVVVKGHRCLFGEVRNDHVVLSDIGRAAEDCWKEIPGHHKGVELDEFIVMPNGIVIIKGGSCRDVQLNVPRDDRDGLFTSKREAMGALSPGKDSLSVVVRTFKAAVTTWARRHGFDDFSWQSRFYDHIIRNEADLHRIRAYMANNPLQWALDAENPVQFTIHD